MGKALFPPRAPSTTPSGQPISSWGTHWGVTFPDQSLRRSGLREISWKPPVNATTGARPHQKRRAATSSSRPRSVSISTDDAPLERILDPLCEKLYDFRADEQNLSDLVGDVDVSWLADRATLRARRRWSVYIPNEGTKFRDHLEAALTGSEPGRRVFKWLGDEREATQEGTADRAHIGHISSHVSAFAVHNVPQALNDEATDSALAQALPTVKAKSVSITQRSPRALLSSSILMEPRSTPGGASQ